MEHAQRLTDNFRAQDEEWLEQLFEDAGAENDTESLLPGALLYLLQARRQGSLAALDVMRDIDTFMEKERAIIDP